MLLTSILPEVAKPQGRLKGCRESQRAFLKRFSPERSQSCSVNSSSKVPLGNSVILFWTLSPLRDTTVDRELLCADQQMTTIL